MPIGQDVHPILVPEGETESGDFVPLGLVSVRVPELDTNATVSIEGSFDDGATWQSAQDVAGDNFASWPVSAGNFILDGDPLARLVGVPRLRFVLGAAQSADVVFLISRGTL